MQMTDVQVRATCDFQQLDCYIRRKRQIYASRLVRYAAVDQAALLQAHTKWDKPLPWHNLLIVDLVILEESVAPKLAHLWHPETSLELYWHPVRDF